MKKTLYKQMNHIYTYISSYIKETTGFITSFTSRLMSSFLKISDKTFRILLEK